MFFAILIFCLSSLVTSAAENEPAGDLAILPAKAELNGPDATARLLLMQSRAGQVLGEVREGVVWRSSDERVAKVAGGVVSPLADGVATITAEALGKRATAEVTIRGQGKPSDWSFRNHVEPVFSKLGCNGGACHGALAGKNGFRLTLSAYDPAADHEMIVHAARGRRVVLEDPGRSLLLTKPSGALPHKGGVRFDPLSLEYRVLAEWLAAGAPPPVKDDPRIVSLEVLPRHSRQKAGAVQQLVVIAHFSDGRSEDVTRWAKFTSTNEAVNSVDPQGKLTVVAPGEGGASAWYLGVSSLAIVSAPYEAALPPDAFARFPAENVIDSLVLAKLQSLNLPPSPRCDDATFLRRVMLDLVGAIPTPEEVRRFLADPAPDKRERLIDQLLARPEFVDYWTYRWSDLLLVSGERLRPQALAAFHGWIRKQVAENTPWDELVRRIVTAKGSTVENGAANFYALHQDPTEMAETVSLAFLGMSIGCAKCHNHPLEKWTNDQYFAFANLFSRVRAKGWGGDWRNGDGNRTVFTVEEGELIQPNSGRPQPPAPLDGAPLAMDSPLDRREPLARWLTSAENPYFTRAIVNRVWANFLGVGLVEKVDDLRLTNPASNEELLAALGRYLVEHHYDLKALMRLIVQSQTYQRSSESVAANRADARFYSHYYPRRLKAEVLLDAFAAAVAAPGQFKDQPAGVKALQLKDAAVDSYFLSTFGRPSRLITCECERSNEPSMPQVFHLLNGDTLSAKLAVPENRIGRLLASQASDEAIVEELYFAALGRPPRESEAKAAAAIVAQTPPAERRAAVEDLLWALCTSKEFLFQH